MKYTKIFPWFNVVPSKTHVSLQKQFIVLRCFSMLKTHSRPQQTLFVGEHALSEAHWTPWEFQSNPIRNPIWYLNSQVNSTICFGKNFRTGVDRDRGRREKEGHKTIAISQVLNDTFSIFTFWELWVMRLIIYRSTSVQNHDVVGFESDIIMHNTHSDWHGRRTTPYCVNMYSTPSCNSPAASHRHGHRVSLKFRIFLRA